MSNVGAVAIVLLKVFIRKTYTITRTIVKSFVIIDRASLRKAKGYQMGIGTAANWGQVITSIFEILGLLYAGVKFFDKLNHRLDRLEEQYKPNGGSSMRDAINRIENKLSKLEGKFEQHVDENNE
jgi:hypothetical protein